MENSSSFCSPCSQFWGIFHEAPQKFQQNRIMAAQRTGQLHASLYSLAFFSVLLLKWVFRNADPITSIHFKNMPIKGSPNHQSCQTFHHLTPCTIQLHLFTRYRSLPSYSFPSNPHSLIALLLSPNIPYYLSFLVLYQNVWEYISVMSMWRMENTFLSFRKLFWEISSGS